MDDTADIREAAEPVLADLGGCPACLSFTLLSVAGIAAKALTLDALTREQAVTTMNAHLAQLLDELAQSGSGRPQTPPRCGGGCRTAQERHAPAPGKAPTGSQARLDPTIRALECELADAPTSRSRHRQDDEGEDWDPQTWMTAREAAATLGKSTRQIQRIAVSLNGQSIGGRWLFPPLNDIGKDETTMGDLSPEVEQQIAAMSQTEFDALTARVRAPDVREAYRDIAHFDPSAPRLGDSINISKFTNTDGTLDERPGTRQARRGPGTAAVRLPVAAHLPRANTRAWRTASMARWSRAVSRRLRRKAARRPRNDSALRRTGHPSGPAAPKRDSSKLAADSASVRARTGAAQGHHQWNPNERP
ncbi:MAG: hypothetical protein U5N53_18490 [Mycobacterium sp.]|nr:hypothetical protein [Mycobacterium sp.]